MTSVLLPKMVLHSSGKISDILRQELSEAVVLKPLLEDGR